MRVGFHYHTPAILNAGEIRMPGPVGRFVDSLASECEHIVCFLHTPLASETSMLDYCLTAKNVDLIGMGPHVSVPLRLMRAPGISRKIRLEGHGLDLLLLRGPSPLLPAIAAASPVPTALLLVGDYTPGVSDLPQPLWRREIIRLWALWNKLGQTHAARHSLTLVNSRVLFEELKDKAPRLHELRTTTLTESDFFFREDTCLLRPVRLLYVGRMARSKGLLDMVEAVSLLAGQGLDVTLDLVGWPEPGDSILDRLRARATELGVNGRVSYLGSRPIGPELSACYRASDIFLNASSSEGFPRTIWEAMANSLPVVATKVGSIPAFIEDSAELVPPRDPAGLARAISCLINDGERRRCFIKKGQGLAGENTLENRSREMISLMQDYLSHISPEGKIS